MHYERWRKFGSTADRRSTLEQRFWAKVDTAGGPTACWPWTAALYSTGYGAFGITSEQIVGAHRMSYQLTHGKIDPDKEIDHVCINRICVNPSHLRQVTRKQNMENRPGAQRNSTTGVRGVTRLADGSWRAQVQHNGVNHYAGTYSALDQAAEGARLKRCELFTHNQIDQQTSISSTTLERT
jgi:hypothetical protein